MSIEFGKYTFSMSKQGRRVYEYKLDTTNNLSLIHISGSGKSTLLHMLGGLDTPTKGSVTLAGKDLYLSLIHIS